VSSHENGELPAEGEVPDRQLRTQPEGCRDRQDQSQNHRHHGRVVPGPEARKVDRFSEIGVLAKHTLKRSVQAMLSLARTPTSVKSLPSEG